MSPDAFPTRLNVASDRTNDDTGRYRLGRLATEGVMMQRADAFIDRIDEKFRALAEQPLMGRERRELGPGIRSIAMAPYVIFYEALPDGVMIVRVLHGARDVEAEFKED